MTTNHRGFTALISAIIISVILLGIAVALGGSTFFARFNALNREYKRISLGLAEACVHEALAKISLDYDYTVVGDPEYNGVRGGVVVPLDSVYGRTTDCLITGPLTTPTEDDGKKEFNIATKAEYAGAFSSLSVSATAQNPEEAPVLPLATCTLTASPASVPLGQSVTLQWSLSPNAEWFSIDHGVRNHVAVGPLTGSVTVTPTSVGSFEYVGTVFNEDDVANDCVNEAVFAVTPPPPAPTCADTVMIFDRTGSLSSGDLNNERNAGNTLVNLYSGAQGSPKIGAGSFGAYPNASLPAGAASVPTNGQLTSSYSTITNLLSQMLGSNSSVGSNLGRAIEVAENELDSVRHDVDKEQVLIFVSDGVPNEPSSGVVSDSGWRSASATATPNEWAVPNNAFSSDNSRATADDDDDDQGYRNFNFSVPGGATIRGIEVRMEGFSQVSGGPAPGTLLFDGFGTGSDDDTFNEAPAWTEGVGNTSGVDAGEKRASGSGGDSPSPEGGRFAVIYNGGWICQQVDASGASNLSLTYRWRGDSDANQSDDDGIVEYRVGGGCNSSSGWNQLQNHDLQNDGSWSTQNAFTLPSAVNNSTFYLRYRAVSESNEYFRVDGVQITGTVAPQNTTCELQARIGDAGNFSSFRSVTLSGTEVVLPILGSATDDWDNVSWSTGDLSNANFRLETRFNDPGNGCDASAVGNLDHVEARVHYTVPVDPVQYTRDAAANAKAGGVSIFAIHYGDTSGQSLMAEIASDSTVGTISITSATRSGGSATITTSAPHRLTQNQRVRISGVSSSAYNGTFTVTSVPSATTFRYSLSGSGNGTGGSAIPLNLFIAPSTSAMSGIFQSIGYQVCPAAAAACGNTIDDDGDGLIDAADSGCHTDEEETNPSSYDPDDGDEWVTPPVLPAPPPPPPPPNIDIGPWVET